MRLARHQPLRVLLAESELGEAASARRLLRAAGPVRLEVEWQSHPQDALLAIRERRHDAYVIDDRLEDRRGLELIREGFAGRPLAPVILLTGPEGPEPDLEAAALGVVEQLVKHELNAGGLERAIRYAVHQHEAISDLIRSEERYALAVRAARDGMWDWDLVADTIHLSPRWHAMLGRSAGQFAETHPSTWFELVHPGDLPRLWDAIRAHLDGATPHLSCEYRMRHADGSWRWVATRGLANRDIDGRATRMAGSLSDVTDRREAELRLHHDALHDALIGLPNRTLFMDRVDQSLRRAERVAGLNHAVLSCDIDRFKLFNDSLSHAVGDKLLVALAGRIATALRPADTLARPGADEFAVLLEDVCDHTEACALAERLVRSLDEPFDIDGHELFTSISVGVAMSTPGISAADLVGNADIAMYNAKRRGRGRKVLFAPAMRRRVVDRLSRENELRQVVEARQLRIHFQPIVHLATGQIRGLEALARWPADRHPVPPSEFISIAEDTGVIGQLGHQVLCGALETLACWRREGLVADDVCMSVNLSGRQLDDPGLAERVRSAIDLADLPPDALKLEITESTLISESERGQRVFTEVCRDGVGLHLDDFGTGYSSLAALHRFPVDALKIDRSFVADILAEGDGQEVIVRSMVAMAHSLGLPVIAEGIETRAQLRRLRELGCDFGQGHLFAPALSEPESRSLLSGWQAAEVMGMAA